VSQFEFRLPTLSRLQSFIRSPHRQGKGRQLAWVQLACGPDAGTQVHAERPYLSDGIADIRRGKAAREEHWETAGLNKFGAYRPIVLSSCSTQFRRRGVGSARVEQEGVNVRTIYRDHLQGCAALDVNNLNSTHLRFDVSQTGGLGRIDIPQNLDSGRMSTAHMGSYRVGCPLDGQQKCSDWRRREFRDLGNSRVSDIARTGRPHTIEAKSVHASFYGQAGFVG